MAEGATPFCARPHLYFSVCRRPQRRGTPSNSKAMNNAKNTTLFPYLERLLEGKEVQWKTLGEVCDILRGKRVTKKELSDEGKYAVFQNSMIPLGHYHKSNVSGDTTFVICAGSAGEIGYSKEDFWAADDVYYFACPNHIISKYLYYFLCTKQSQILQQVRKASIPRLSKQSLEKLLFPLPPLRVQARIVEILDKFTQLEAELESELEARKKQYAYYRDQLLNFSQCPPLNVNIEWKTLGEVCHIVGRIGFRGYTRNDIVERGEGAISISPTNIINQHLNLSAEINTYISWEKYDESPEIKIEIGDIVLVKTGSTVGKTAIVRELIEKATINPQMVVLKEIQCSPAYLSHYINTPYFQLKLKSLCGQGSVPNISQTKLSTIPIPLPPLSEQRRIVDILDRFDTLTNSISEGLPKEIALRRKQYEYYRDALLNFPRAEVTA